ncbi:S-layer homology domain-containing protein [Sedimentibacter hydroxybenzoicus DSM 7310]|uniref:S-layer homology domain-containing protein n=1 Tax=Sedimentibacter hydroxybenzoicus DSM 7310 TaxID=1123245 RepID=A0A974BMQ5_SEDHY|nr:S-layer homology domain-containing protein [Sedimentibacter hydroxybenzoicus]NYB75691.1 S-layer homology domain-containing protein [Sedimentibacter hydroxybenzoicus DSM 7310]
MKRHAKKGKQIICIVLVMCIIFNSYSGLAYTDIDNPDNKIQLSAHEAALQSLTEQLNNKGIGLYSIMGDDIVISPSGYDFGTRVSCEINEPINVDSDHETTATITFRLNSPNAGEVSFYYRVYPGSAFSDKHYEDVANGRITFEAGETEKSIDIEISEIDSSYNAENPEIYEYGELWTGDRVLYISCYDISNALFENDKEVMTVPVRIENALNLKHIYEGAADVFMADISSIQNADSFPDVPGKYINKSDVINIATATAITADVRKMIDIGTFSHLNLPIGYFLNESGASGNVNLHIIKNPSSIVFNRSTLIDTGDGENKIDFEFNDALLSDLGIGRNSEANGAVNSICINLNYSIINGDVYTLFHDAYGNYVQNQMNFEDKINPFPVNANAPAGEYHLGESVPVTVTFNEAVLTDNISIKANDTVLYPVEREGTISEDVSFLYEVGPDFDGYIDIQDVTGAVDLSGKEQDYMTYNSRIEEAELKSYSMKELLSYCAATEIKVNQGKSMNAEVEINISLKENHELSDYLTLYKEDGRIKTVKAKVIGENGTDVDIDLYANDGLLITQLRGKFTAPASSLISDTNYVCEIYFDENEDNNFELIYSLSKQYTMPQIIYIDDESYLEILYENWPAENKVSSNSIDLISLGYNVKNNATWQKPEDFVWTSSDQTVAAITTSGAISLTGKPGSVYFSLSALNSGQPDERFTVHSNTLQVIDTDEVFLNVSGWSKNAEIIKGNDAKIYYSTNLHAVNGTATAFYYNLYEAEYEGDEITKGESVLSDTKVFSEETQELYYAVDKQYLNNVSERGKYSYILEISARDIKTDMLFTASASIRVKSLPAKAMLSKPESYYITDEADSFIVKFDIDNYNPDTEVMLTVTRNAETIITKNSISDRDKDITVNIEDVPDLNLYDTYAISLQAKNIYDEAYSYDSYTMYVYNSDALKISINGKNKEKHTMSMDDKLKSMSSEEILNLNRNIALTDDININNEYKWSRLFDKTTWSAEDDSILSLRYKDGGLLSNVDGNTLVLPDAELLLEGLSPGKSSITLRHGLTGMEEKVEVDVDNLKEKLFLFQVYPAQKSNVTYRDGNNSYKEAETDEKGRIAIFEESGIDGDITFKPENGDLYDTYVLSNTELKSKQQGSDYSGLYPQNNIVFKKSDYEAMFYVWRVDSLGRTFLHEGDVTIKGGVYRNGIYCPDAAINGKSGQEEQIVSKTGYEYILKFDQNQFVNDKYDSPVTAEDKIEYIFEVGIPGHFPGFMKVDNETIRFFKKYYDTPVPAGTVFLKGRDKSRIENGISIVSQKLVSDGNETDMPENIIIEDISKSAYISTEMAFNGNRDSSYNVRFYDKKSNLPADLLKTEAEVYEFSDTVLIKNTLDVQRYVSGLEFGEVRSLSMQITVEDDDGLEIINLPSNYNMSRINGISKLSTLESGNLNKLKQDVRSSINGPSMINSDGYADYIQTALGYLSGFKVDSDKLRLEITPTDNPLVFKGVITMGVGQMSQYMRPGVHSRDEKASLLYDYMPDYETFDSSSFIGNSKIYMDAYMGGYGSNSKTYGGGAYFDCEIFYDIDDGEWKIVVLKSFVHVGGGYHYKRIYNTWIGPVPVTAEFLAGGTGQLNLKMVSDGSGAGSTYITELSPYIYIRGFGGVGRDYKVVSLKAGVYGKVSLDQQYLWLRSEQKNSNGQRIVLAGETGIEYEIKLVLVNIEGTYEIGAGSKTWTFNDYNNIKKQYDSIKYNLVLDKHMGLASEEFEGKADFEFPDSNPVFSTDGDMMVYISDMDSHDLNEASVCFSLKSAGVFPEGTEIDASGYADTEAVIDGTKGGAAVAWTRVITDMELKEGSEAAAEDIQNMISGTEIMAGIYDGSEFTSTRLTDNSTADMSPVVASNGEKAIVAWRSLYAGDMSSLLSFDGRDNIMYRVYDGSSWSEEKCLYDGSTDRVNTLNAKMLSDGTSAIVYEVTMEDTDNTEIFCTVIDEDGSILKNIRLSNNEDTDRNPQITSVLFPDDHNEERFVIGWNSFIETSTIRIAVVDGNGNVYTQLETEIEGSYTTDYGSFKFTKGAERLQDLSVVWVQPEFDSEDNYSHALWGRKFLPKGDGLTVSPEIRLLKLDDNNLTDHYDAYVGHEGKINFVLQTTDYNAEEEHSNIIYGQTEYKNEISVEQVYYNRNEILPGNEMPFMFRIYNSGIEPINSLNINFGGIVHEFGAGDYIMPGQYKDINIFYPVPENITDPSYFVTAEYLSSDSDTVSGTIKLDVPDVGIYGIDVVKEAQRERVFSVMLHNNTCSKLTDGKHRVKLYVYDNPDSEATPVVTETISDADSLNMINNGMFSKNILLNEEALQGILNDEGEIPDDGARIFFKTAIEENNEEIEDSNISNDWNYIKIRGLISKNMERASLASRMKSQSGHSSVQVELTNNSMNEISGGTIAVSLKNEDGNIIETKSFGGKTSLVVGGEETFSTTFDFNSEGASFEAVYTAENPDDGKDYSDKTRAGNIPEEYVNPFKDVRETDWFYDAVKFVLENGLMIGTGADTFSPELSVTRGMLVTILHRLEKQPSVANCDFTDVVPGDYYHDAVAWAQQNGIVMGIDDTIFGPDENITREQLVTILYRYFLYISFEAEDMGADLSEFKDNDLISDYALSAMRWAVGKGLIKGRGEVILAPKGNATRAETAMILQRFIEGNR